MKAIPIELKTANEFVAAFHRHHKPVYRDKFRIVFYICFPTGNGKEYL